MREKLVHSAVNRTKVGIVITDPTVDDNPIVYVNDWFQKLTLYSREYALGRNCRFLQGDKTSETAKAQLRRAVENAEEIAVSIVNYKADGTAFLNHLTVSPVMTDEGEVTAFFAVQREGDLSEDGNQTHNIASTGLNAMLREIQHRVKNHLSMIVSLIRVQANRQVTKDSYLALSHRIEALALLYDELLKPEAEEDKGKVAAGAYLSRVATVIAGLDGRASIRLRLDCDEMMLPTDPTARLGLLLTELLTNTFHHAFEGRKRGCVTVSLKKQENGRVHLIVEDDGVGLPPGNDWPYQSDSVARQRQRAENEPGELNTTSNGKSSGLGGSIVLGLTKALDAHLDVQSGNTGTRICVDLDPSRAPPEQSE